MSKLALLGGDKTVTLDYNTVGFESMITDAGIEKAIELMKKGQISTSPTVKSFEAKFANYIGTKHCLCANSGTSSIQEALFAVGVSPGDEVITPSYTYWATAGPIVACGASAVFCDVDMETFCIDPKEIAKLITKKTKAIILTHVWGTPCDMDAINKIAKENSIAVIEDASHAHGSTYKGKKIGAVSDIGCFSLQGSKILVAGEGGMITTDNTLYYERAMSLGHYERLEKLPEASDYRKFFLTGLGLKHRVHPLGIAIADAGLDILDERNRIRNENAKYLEDCIKDVPCIIPQKCYEGTEKQYSYHFVRYEAEQMDGISAISFIRALAREGMEVGLCGYGRLHKAPLFLEGVPFGSGEVLAKSEPVELPVTDFLAKNTFLLAPRFETECKTLIEQYATAVHKVYKNKDALKKYDVENQDTSVYDAVSARSINAL